MKNDARGEFLVIRLRHFLLFLVEVIYLAVHGIVFLATYTIVDDRLNKRYNRYQWQD